MSSISPSASGIDPISYVSLPLVCKFDGQELSTATGFIRNYQNQAYLITNWHVVSGRNYETGKVISTPTAGIPNTLEVLFPRENRSDSPLVHTISLFDAESLAVWFVHPTKGHSVDVVAIPISIPCEVSIKTCDQIKIVPIMQRIGMPVFIIGYPFGRKGFGFPVWKQGTFATEPSLSPKFEDYLLVDSASRPGMSGSLVLQREHGLVTQENGVASVISGGKGAARLVGVYSGRLHTSDKEDAQLGIVWSMDWVSQIICGMCRDKDATQP